MVEKASKLFPAAKGSKRMQNRKVRAFAVPAIAAGLLLLSTPAQAKPEQTSPSSTVVKSATSKTSTVRKNKTARARVKTLGSTPVTAEQAQIAIAAALTKESGARYRAGGIGPNSFDCSGLVRWAYEQAGIYLPHGTGNLLPIVQPIAREELIPGDLVFSGRSGSGVQHVSLYIGDGKVIHATYASASPANQVRIDDLDDSWVMVHKSYGRVVQ